MQIDGHHALTYTVSRMAGFEHKEAEIIAYAAQYVDDATNSGLIKFKDGPMYSRISSAHGVFDMANHLDEHENHLVWVPFHFLPGNGGEDENGGKELSFVEKIKCTKDSYIAREMIDYCVAGKDKEYALHRLGISMHVYADTFAHWGFAGVIHDINKINNLEMENEDIIPDRQLPA
jgi:hypothetical protein